MQIFIQIYLHWDEAAIAAVATTIKDSLCPDSMEATIDVSNIFQVLSIILELKLLIYDKNDKN